jgi:hypothetical protein
MFPPKLPEEIQDLLSGRKQLDKIITHCRRELMHRVWDILLDDEFLEAYEHGFVMEFVDGIIRRWYPRIFTQSNDYPEKCVNLTLSPLNLI